MINPTGGFGFSHHRLLDVIHCASPISLSILPCDDPFRKLYPSSLDTTDSNHQKVAETSLYAWRTGDHRSTEIPVPVPEQHFCSGSGEHF